MVKSKYTDFEYKTWILTGHHLSNAALHPAGLLLVKQVGYSLKYKVQDLSIVRLGSNMCSYSGHLSVINTLKSKQTDQEDGHVLEEVLHIREVWAVGHREYPGLGLKLGYILSYIETCATRLPPQ